ncbi:MAG: CoA transferase [Dehalococcoidia bacterium]|nr:CoA transferase [Dehalococcoidia bacterium]
MNGKRASQTKRTPLHGLRVIDLGQVYAGPYAARILADMGAEVIRVESAVRSGRGGQNPQPGAIYPDGDPGKKPYNRSAYYNELNRNKLAVSLDLSKEQGREVFKRLVKVSDGVIENFSPRVMANFELDYPVLSQINPKIIMASISGYGQTGPYRDYVSFGRGIEAMSGLSEITGYEDGQPLGPGIAYADANAGLHAAFAILAALRQRRRTGKGQHIDLSLRESLTSLLGEQIINSSMNHRAPVRKGNQDCPKAFQGCYRCRGDDAWIAISICSKQEWKSLWSIIGHPPNLPDLSILEEGREELERLIECWTLEYEPEEAMNILQRAGVRAGMVCGAGELTSNPHLQARGSFEKMAHPEAGIHPNPGMPWKFSRSPLHIRMPAPCFAQHNNYVFGDLLGMSSEEIAKLEAEGVTARFPTR